MKSVILKSRKESKKILLFVAAAVVVVVVDVVVLNNPVVEVLGSSVDKVEVPSSILSLGIVDNVVVVVAAAVVVVVAVVVVDAVVVVVEDTLDVGADVVVPDEEEGSTGTRIWIKINRIKLNEKKCNFMFQF